MQATLKGHLVPGLLLVTAVLQGACEPPPETPDAGTRPDAACTPGSDGCACLGDGTCLEGAPGTLIECASGTCTARTCEDGNLGCPCLGDGSCSDEMHACNADLVCELAACPPGTLDCGCLSGERCTEDATVCSPSNLCVPVLCPTGQDGCACNAGGSCGVSASGELLACDPSNVCLTAQCPAGQTGCACLGGHDCVAQDAECRDGYCQPAACSAGSEHCACAGGGCNPGLRCQAGRICVDSTGSTGGPCDASGGCLRGNRCQDQVCVPCSLGSQACGCTDISGCNTGLECQSGTCVAVTGFALNQPADFRCYTPCQDGYDAADGYRTCSSEGLMEGCLDGQRCVEPGQCVAEGAAPGTCQRDVDCPQFHTCLSGQCRSNCRNSDDCVTGANCIQHVCRLRCNMADAACPRDYFCSTADAESGFCMPVDDSDATGVMASSEPFELSEPSLTFSNGITTGQIELTNSSRARTTYTVRKVEHSYTDNQDRRRTTRLQVRGDDLHRDLDACTAGTAGCRCREVNGEEICAPLSTGLALTCEADDVCHLPACTGSEPGCVCRGTDCRTVCEHPDCPLWWLELEATQGSTLLGSSSGVALDVTLAPGETATVRVKGAGGYSESLWSGLLEVDNGSVRKKVQLRYSETPQGAWTGSIYYFGDFRLDDVGLEAWQDSDHNPSLGAGTKNAFLKAWASYRAQSHDLAAFRALLTATRTESWRSPVLRQRCGAGRICYPYLNTDGFLVYTNEPDEEPVPSGVVEYPFAMNIQPLQGDSPARYQGRIDSARALQYAGNPAIDIEFANAPSTCSSDGQSGCLVYLERFDADIIVGGRHLLSPAPEDTCSERYTQKLVPWLVPGLRAGAYDDEDTGRRYRRECRDSKAPLSGDNVAELNLSLTGANPVPDGRERRRRLELVDGALVNTDTMFVVFRERIPSLIDANADNDLVAYGYMVLRRTTTDLEGSDYVGSRPPASLGTPAALPPLTCDPALLSKLQMDMGVDPVNDPSSLASILLNGRDMTTTPEPISESAPSGEMVHYLCEDTNLFDKGLIGTSSDEEDVACPAGSRVIYFTVDRTAIPQSVIDSHSCRQYRDDATRGCKAVLQTWRDNGKVLQGRVRITDAELVWTCTDTNQAYCSLDRKELRAGKTFYKMGQSADVAFLPLRASVNDAFRYRTRFQNRQGTGLGFVPSLCAASAETVPYCYDPDGIEQSQQRIDCLLALYTDRYDELLPAVRNEVRLFLTENFAYSEQADAAQDITIYHSGHEKLFVELLVMLGDDGYTKALSSRFDLAGLNIASFEGALLEPGGINLSGIAGAEMYNLYLAGQYYQLALERFFKLLPSIQREVDDAARTDKVVGQATVVEYLGRLIRASTQKVKVWSEVSKRYQNFNRPDLARLVIERGYTAAYLESIILTNLMQRISGSSDPVEVAQIVTAIQQAQISYRVALTDMRTQYDAIRDDINYFGFAPDYIPFPATEASVARDNGFEVLSNRAWQRLQIAQQAEDTALQTTRSFDIDAASFQSELIRVENNYEGQLAELCGTFAAGGRVYPAIRKYAYLDQKAELLGDPCGQMGTGQLHEAKGAIDLELVDMKRLQVSMRNTQDEAGIEEDRIDAVCNSVDSFRNTYLTVKGEQNTIQATLDELGFVTEEMDRALQAAMTFAQLAKCSVIVGVAAGSDCPAAGIAAGVLGAYTIVNEVAHLGIKAAMLDKQDELRELQVDEGRISFDMQCNDQGTGLNQIDSAARVRTILLRLKELEVDALRGSYEMQQALARVQQLRQQSRRIQDELDEMQQLTINVEAARNNPNVRIYKNDAVINADKTFYSALAEVYKATRVYEFYSSQSYAQLDQLFLVRMITRGDYNLQNYLIELEDAFREFEDQYGQADLRVTRLSLRDDILQVPNLNVVGSPLSQGERIALFRERLQDPALLDENGYITVPFGTALDQLSPLTRNHKVKYVQAQIIGSDYGDQTARVYLRARGTSAVASVSDEILYYTFPERTAVINAFFLDQNAFDPAVYRNTRFTDRPYLNTRWELVLNMVDETANQDIALDGLTDIRLYLYYTDFTVY